MPPDSRPTPRSPGRRLALALAAVVAVSALAVAAYVALMLNWAYSSGERAGYVQKLSRKGWICKTWEGELAMVSLPGAMPEKFEFSVRDDGMADRINRAVGKRVALVYEQHRGLPTQCFGETEYFVTDLKVVE